MPPKLIRNIDGKFCDEFMCHGKLRLKPVAGYVDIANPVIADKTEGARGIEARPQSNITVFSDQLWTPANVSFRGTRPNARPFFFAVVGSTVSFVEALPQAYVLCLSENRNPKFGDAAFVVNDPKQFGLGVLRALYDEGRKILQWRLAKVRYGSHKDTVVDQLGFEKASMALMNTDSSEGYFTKPTVYADEREWRYVFIVEDQEQPLTDIDLCDRSLIEFCERYSED